MRIVLFLCFLGLSNLGDAQLIDFNAYHRLGDTVPALLMPVSKIYFIEKGNKTADSDSLSLTASKQLFSLMEKQQLAFHADTLLRFADLNDSNMLHSLQYELENSLPNEKEKKKMLPPILDSILTEANKRYAYIIFHTGFTRRKGNYSGQVWKSIGIGVLTMGNYYSVPYKASSNLYLFKIDGTKKTIECIDQSINAEKDPLDFKKIEKQLNSMINEYVKKK